MHHNKGGRVILRSWSETRELRTIQTSDGFVTVNKGDIVVVAVISKWSDVEKIFGSMLAKPEDADGQPDKG